MVSIPNRLDRPSRPKIRPVALFRDARCRTIAFVWTELKVSPEKLQPIVSGPITDSLTIGAIRIYPSVHHFSHNSTGGSVAKWLTRRTRNPAVSVPVPLWPLAGFVNGRPEFKSSATLVNSQVGASGQLGFLILLCYIWNTCFKLFEWIACKLAG